MHTGILMDSSIHRQNGYAGMSLLGINRECSSTGIPKSGMNVAREIMVHGMSAVIGLT